MASGDDAAMGVYQDIDHDDEDYDDDDDDGDEAEEGYDENDRIEQDLLDLVHLDNNKSNNNNKRTTAKTNKSSDTHHTRIPKQRTNHPHAPSQYVDTLLRGFEATTAPGLVRPVSANAAVKIRKQQQLQQQRNNHHNLQNHTTTTSSSSNGYNLSERMQQVKVGTSYYYYHLTHLQTSMSCQFPQTHLLSHTLKTPSETSSDALLTHPVTLSSLPL